MNSLARFVLLLLMVFATFFCSLTVNAQQTIAVKIVIDNPQHHYAKIMLNYDNVDTKQITLKLPTWRTGRYEILNLANGIREFDVYDDQGNKLPWQKIDKDSWQIKNTLNRNIEIAYQVYANQLGQRTRHIDDSHAFLDASTVVMYSDTSRDYQHVIDLSVPATWRSVSGLTSGLHEHQFIAENYDVLVDSPIETGVNEFHQFVVDGRDYELVIWGKGNYDSAKMVADLKVLVQQSKAIWQGYPFKRYVFMVHATSGARGATEHLNSTIIQRSRFKFSTRKDYLGFIATAAHEFVHTWNVKQYRPKGLVPYDYQNENYSTLLWLSEGSTSYLQDQLLLRGNLMSTKEFFEKLAKRITAHKHKPGRKSQTIAQSSFDKWLAQGGDYDNNHSVNIYSEGFLVSWLLDFSIIEKTAMTKSYRDVHNILYQDYSIPKTFNESDLLTILQQVTHSDYSQWWQENIHGYVNIDFAKLLAKAGLSMHYGEGKKTQQQAWLGAKTRQVTNGLQITVVEKGSPAWQSGLTTDDIIVAVDSLRMADKDLSARLKNFKPNDRVSVTFFRRDELVTRMVTLGEKPKGKLTIKPMKKANANQRAFFKQWTGLDFPSK